MSEHRAQLRWKRTSQDFTYASYNRAHEILFKDGAIVLPSSSAPEFRGDPERVDPEEAFVASLSGCHMLTFLAICARKRLTLDAYDDREEIVALRLDRARSLLAQGAQEFLDAIALIARTADALERAVDRRAQLARVDVVQERWGADGQPAAPDLALETGERVRRPCGVVRQCREPAVVEGTTGEWRVDPAALGALVIVGDDPALPSVYRVGLTLAS